MHSVHRPILLQTPLTPTPCLCGSGQDFSACCEPLINLQTRARTARALMQSRYTAYVLRCSDYILQTWAPVTRPKILDLSTDQVKWLSLEIDDCRDGLEDDREGEVEFTATYLAAGCLWTMHENSRFIRPAQYWYYLDGRCASASKRLERNSPCPCNSGKKFKRCCGLR